MDKCPKYQNNRYFDARLKRRRRKEKKKIAHVFLQLFLSSNERYIFKEQYRIRISHHKYPTHSIHMHILI
jgi:hypothetical protein